ncbi:MAG: ketopantoate reductase family protein [Candidatus Gastranaerophilales bacterium]|nr:ketopantoate reductase family protein [Candidatus Gastranaerophilales bacterium]
MGGINRVIICGLGAVGLTYANKLKNVCELKILVDETRLEKFRQNPPVLNGAKIDLDYITPEKNWDADLIIIATKASGLDSAISYIKNFVGENTLIISLLNGISSEDEIAKVYGKEKVVPAYFIGHSAVRDGNSVTQDGVGRIVFGKNERLEQFFKENNIDYEIPEDIIYSLWLKFTMNIFSNQTSAVLNLTFGEMKRNEKFKEFAKKLIAEVRQIGEASGVKGLENLEKDAFIALSGMVDDGKTSMLQDILAGRKTEADIFAGEIIRRGKEFGIETPYNKTLYDLIKILEDKGVK